MYNRGNTHAYIFRASNQGASSDAVPADWHRRARRCNYVHGHRFGADVAGSADNSRWVCRRGPILHPDVFFLSQNESALFRAATANPT
jgi:hypothetical protein